MQQFRADQMRLLILALSFLCCAAALLTAAFQLNLLPLAAVARDPGAEIALVWIGMLVATCTAYVLICRVVGLRPALLLSRVSGGLFAKFVAIAAAVVLYRLGFDALRPRVIGTLALQLEPHLGLAGAIVVAEVALACAIMIATVELVVIAMHIVFKARS